MRFWLPLLFLVLSSSAGLHANPEPVNPYRLSPLASGVDRGGAVDRALKILKEWDYGGAVVVLGFGGGTLGATGVLSIWASPNIAWMIEEGAFWGDALDLQKIAIRVGPDLAMSSLLVGLSLCAFKQLLVRWHALGVIDKELGHWKQGVGILTPEHLATIRNSSDRSVKEILRRREQGSTQSRCWSVLLGFFHGYL